MKSKWGVMLFIYFISKASAKVALTLLGLEGRSCWALLDHPSSLSPRVCPEEPQTQSPFCLYTETINIKTSLQTLPRRPPFPAPPGRPPPPDLRAPLPALDAGARPGGGSETAGGPLRHPAPLEARRSSSGGAEGRPGEGRSGRPHARAALAPARPPRGLRTHAACLHEPGWGGGGAEAGCRGGAGPLPRAPRHRPFRQLAAEVQAPYRIAGLQDEWGTCGDPGPVPLKEAPSSDSC